MPKTKKQKQKILEEIKEKIKKQKSIVLVGFSGLSVKEFTQLRTKMKKNDCEIKVCKKTLIQKAFRENDLEIKDQIKNLQGEIALGFGYADEVLAFKILGDFSKTTENLRILAGIMDNKFLDVKQALFLTELPTKQELMTRIVGSIKAPITNFVYTLQGNIKGLLCVLKQIKT